jgi:hypothetical protein
MKQHDFAPSNGICALAYSTFFGRIAVTGLRVSEALSLDKSDVDCSNGLLSILSVRRGKSVAAARIVPAFDRSAAKGCAVSPLSLHGPRRVAEPGDATVARTNSRNVLITSAQPISPGDPARDPRSGTRKIGINVLARARSKRTDSKVRRRMPKRHQACSLK